MSPKKRSASKNRSESKRRNPYPEPVPGLTRLHFYDPFVNQLVSYFGDDVDEDAIALLRGDIAKNRNVRLLWRQGLRDALAEPPPVNRVKLVRNYANRAVSSDVEARAWLASVQAALFRD